MVAPNKKCWSDEEVQDVCTRYINSESLRDIGKTYNVTTKVIARILKLNNIHIRTKSESKSFPRPNRRSYDLQTEQEIVKLYQAGINIRQLSRRFNLERQSIRTLLQRHNITIIHYSSPRKYSCNDTFFDQLNEYSCYWMGFLGADGAIFKNSEKFGKLRLTLGIKDINHLKQFKEHLSSNAPIVRYIRKIDLKEYAYIDINSIHIVNTLIHYTITPKKTFTIQWPNHIPNELLRHYLRGYFDGDGYWNVSTVKRKLKYTTGSQLILRFTLPGNITFLTALQQYLIDECQLEPVKLTAIKNRNQQIAYLGYSGRKQVNRIFALMYKNANIYLERKIEKIKPYIYPSIPDCIDKAG